MSIAQNKQRIAVLAGGYSGEAVISLQSAATVMEHLDRSLFDPILVRIDSDRWWADVDGQPSINKSTFNYTQNDINHAFDAVFIMVHGLLERMVFYRNTSKILVFRLQQDHQNQYPELSTNLQLQLNSERKDLL